MRKTIATLVIGLIVVGAIWVSFRATHHPTTPAATSFHGKVGVVPAAYYLPIFVAKEKGFFKDEGLDVDIVNFDSNADLFTAFLHGDLDATALGSGGAFPFQAADPGRIKFIYGQNNQSYSFVVKKGSSITSIKMLKGKRIGTWPSPTPRVFIKLTLDTQGLAADTDYEIRPLEFKSLNRALENGDVDALFNTDLFTEAGIQGGISQYLSRRPLPDLLINPTFNGGGLLRAEMLKSDPDRSGRYVRALNKAIVYIQQHERDARLVMRKYLPFEEAVVLNAPLDEFISVDHIDVDKAQTLADMMVKEGLVKKKIDVESMIYRGAVK